MALLTVQAQTAREKNKGLNNASYSILQHTVISGLGFPFESLGRAPSLTRMLGVGVRGTGGGGGGVMTTTGQRRKKNRNVRRSYRGVFTSP